MSHFVELLVWEPVAVINEGGEHHVESGGSFQLSCSLSHEGPNGIIGKERGQEASLMNMARPTVRFYKLNYSGDVKIIL